jgi:glyoxalase family protein
MSSGGRMEMCTTGPGFLIDEAYEDLGNRLCLSPRVEPLRAKLERERPAIVNPRPRGKATAKKRKRAEASEHAATNGAPAEPAKAS